MFYESLATIADLQTEVAVKLRELESAGNPLTSICSRIAEPVDGTWAWLRVQVP